MPMPKGPEPAAPPTRPRNADATRLDLLRAAQRRFTVLGYERTTTREVAADVGVNVSLINRYFGSKDGLFAAVLQEYTDTLGDEPPATDAAAMVEVLLAGFAPDAWPEFGNEHPLLLLLRGTGDDPAAGLRRRALASSVTRMQAPLPDDVPDDVRRLRGQLLLALFAGVVVLRTALPDEPIATGDADALRIELERITSAVAGGES